MITAGIAKTQGTSFISYYVHYFSFEHTHHAYKALYAVVALTFVYHVLSTCWKKIKIWLRILLLISVVVLICYIVLVNSRAGMLAMVISGGICILHLAITHSSWKLGIGIALLFCFGIYGATQVIPSYKDRLTDTFKDFDNDVRMTIYRSNWHAFTKSPLVGHGIGDSPAIQLETYQEDGFERGIRAKYNAHNQYLDSLVSTGLLGLLSLFFFLLTPIIVAYRYRNKFLFMIALLTGIVMFNLLFESMLDRQMGLLFIGWLYTIMVLIMGNERGKNDVKKVLN